MTYRCFYLIGMILVAGLMVGLKPPAAAKSGQSAPAKPQAKGDPYPLDVCIVSGEKLGSMGKPVVKEYDGREVRFCCKACVAPFEKDQANFIKKIDEKIIEQQIKHYPLTTCVVMEDEELTEEGEMVAYNHVHNNRLVRFCCKGCLPEFKKDPAKYLAKIDAAVIKQQKAEYPLDTCPISGKKLGEGAVDHVAGVALVRFCCKDCIAKFNEDPHPVMAKLHEGWKARHSKEKDPQHNPDHNHKHDHNGHSH